LCDLLKWHNQSNGAASRANKMLGLIKNGFKTRDPLALKKLYCGLVRPLLDYAASVWSPYSVGDKKFLEKVKRRATKLPRICRDLLYNERLKLLNLQSLHAMADSLNSFKNYIDNHFFFKSTAAIYQWIVSE
jgi:hypothetical protein